MNAAALSITVPHPVRKGGVVQRDSALTFLDSIDSSWKGHEPFAMWLIQKLHPKTTVDIGFDRGLSTIAFAYKNRGHVFGIDWFQEGNYAQKSFALDAAFRNISNALRFKYAKNIHLIIGPFREVSRKWDRKIDLLHIDWSHTYFETKLHFDTWAPYLKREGVVLIHDVLSRPEETGRFFRELPYHKILFPHAEGLGVASQDEELIAEIRKKFFEFC